MMEKRTLLLYTGGTLGMKENSEGQLFPAPGFLKEALNKMEEIHAEKFPKWELLEHDPLVDSTTFTPKNWVVIAKDIEKYYKAYDGFVILTGTDTMAYTASALSFMLTNLSKPVIFTGSQIPLEQPFNDARRNLITSIMISVDSRTPNEVCLFFNDNLFRGNRAIKMSSSGLDAFSSPNYPPFARLSAFHLKYAHDCYVRNEFGLSEPSSRFFDSIQNGDDVVGGGGEYEVGGGGEFKICTQVDVDIVVICITPAYRDSTLMALLSSPTLRGIVLQLYGSGNIPAKRKEFQDFIKETYSRGIVVCVVTQCMHGGIASPSPYAVVSPLFSMGVASGGDMTTEAVVAKMAFLLGLFPNDISAVREFLGKNLKGELTDEDTPNRRKFCIGQG